MAHIKALGYLSKRLYQISLKTTHLLKHLPLRNPFPVIRTERAYRHTLLAEQVSIDGRVGPGIAYSCRFWNIAAPNLYLVISGNGGLRVIKLMVGAGNFKAAYITILVFRHQSVWRVRKADYCCTIAKAN